MRRRMGRTATREAQAAWVGMMQHPAWMGLPLPSPALRREYRRSERWLVHRPLLHDALEAEVMLGLVRSMVLPLHHRAQAAGRACGDPQVYWQVLCGNARGTAAAVLGRTLYRGWRDAGYLDAVGDEWLASADRVRQTYRRHPGLTVEEAQLLELADPAVTAEEEWAVERGLRACGLA